MDCSDAPATRGARVLAPATDIVRRASARCQTQVAVSSVPSVQPLNSRPAAEVVA